MATSRQLDHWTEEIAEAIDNIETDLRDQDEAIEKIYIEPRESEGSSTAREH